MSAANVESIETAWIALPDGTRLAARLWLPAGARDAPVPAVLEFLPYRRRDVTSPRDESTYPVFAANGYAGVRVDARGNGDSDGLFDDEYSKTELGDIEAVIAWIAAQPWCDGVVGMMGISWGGFNALQTAARRPPALRAVISIASSVDRYADDIHYRGGCHLSANLYWATTVLGNTARPPDPTVVGEGWRETWLRRLDALEPLSFPWIEHGRRDAYWRHGSICEDYAALADVPALVIAGWADGYRNTPTKAVTGLANGSKAIVGPWIHKYPHFAYPHPRIDFHAEAIAWWDRWLKGIANGVEALPEARAFIAEGAEGVRLGDRREREAGRWVARERIGADVPALSLNLHPDGALRAEIAPEAALTLCSPQGCGAASGEFFTVNAECELPGDQAPDDARSTVFETPPLKAPLDLLGRPRLRLRLAIDVPLGNLFARLVDVHPNGAARLVSLGMLNLAHREGSEAPTPMTPGGAEAIELHLDEAGYRFNTGHRLRLALSTVYFPMALPPPEAVTATLTTGPDTGLDLPIPDDLHDIALPPPANADPLQHYPTTTPAASRTTTHEAGTTVCTIEDDSGTITHPENGVVWRETRRSVWSIGDDDPLSLEGTERTTALRERPGWRIETAATGRLTATADAWHVEASITAIENGAEVFARSWTRRIARDCM